MQHAINTEEIW